MATLVVQPSKIYPVGKSDCITYCIIATETILTSGTKATAYIDFDGTTYANNLDIVFAGVTFRTWVSPGATDINFNADAETAADNFMTTLELNAEFFGFATWEKTDQGGGVFRVTVTWNEQVEQTDFTFDYSALSPEPGHGETNGSAHLLLEGLKLRYQLWEKDADGDIYPVTNIESVVPRTNPLGVPRLCFDFRNDIQGLVSTTWQSLTNTDIVEDENYSTYFFLKYGVRQVVNCEVTEWDWDDSGDSLLVNAVFQLDDDLRMRRYYYDVSINPIPPFLTARPNGMPIKPDSYYWLWFYGQHLGKGTGWTKYRAQWNFFDSSGANLGTEYSATEPDYDGFFVIPCGGANSPGIPADTALITVQIDVYEPSRPGWVQASEVRTMPIDPLCGDAEFHFLEDLGAYSVIYGEIQEVHHNQVMNIFRAPEVCDNAEDAVRQGGRRRVKVSSNKKFTCRIVGLDSDEQAEWFRQFLDSEDIKYRYENRDGDTMIRNIIIDSEETLIYKTGSNGEYLTLEFSFTYHTDLR